MLLPTVVLASTTLGYKVGGIQVGIIGPDGSGNFTSSFAGAASSTTQAGEFGLWKASVYRTPFVGGNATILPGGTFGLKSTVRTVVGTFTGGSIELQSATLPCGNEVFAVIGSMTAASGSESGTGTFVAKLTHYRRVIFGSCRTVGASVVGTVQLTLG